MVRRIVLAAFGVLVLRWAALEVAAYAARHWLRHGPPAKDSPRPPGHMPGPLD